MRLDIISKMCVIILIGTLLINFVIAVSDTVNVDIVETRDFEIDFVKVNGPTSFEKTISDTLLFINKTYPIADEGVTFFEVSGSIDTSNWGTSDIALFKLRLLWTLRKRSLISGHFTERVIGVLPQYWILNNLGESSGGFAIVENKPLAKILSPKSVIIEEGYKSAGAHELGHSYGLCDEYSSSEWEKQDTLLGISDFCPNGDDNNNDQLDDNCYSGGCTNVTIGTLIPWNDNSGEIEIYNFMGDLDSQQDKKWITPKSYNHLLDKFSSSTPIVAQSRLLIVGLYDKINKTVNFTDFYQLGEGLADNESEFIEGNYSIESLNESDGILSNFTFDLSFVLSSGDGNTTELNVTPFVLVIPFSENVSKITFLENQTTIEEKNRTANTPSLEITTNLSGQNYSGELFNLTWNSSDIDNDTIVHAILFSTDDGGNYTTLEIDYNQTNITLNSSNLPGCSLCRIKVLATDGINTNSSVSDSFKIDTTPPNISWVMTIPEEYVPLGENLTFYTNVIDDISDVDSVWLKIWEGVVGISHVIWQGFLSLFTGDIWSIEVETNESFSVGEVNYTVYANDTLGNEINVSGSFTINGPPTTPTTLLCNGTPCTNNDTFLDEIEINCSGSTDPENNNITYFIDAYYNRTGSGMIDRFNNSLTTENFNFTGNENITRYLEILRYVNVTSAYMNFSGNSNKLNIVSSYVNTSLLVGASSVHVIDDYAYVTGNKNDSLAIINISDKTNPTLVSSFINSSSLSGVFNSLFVLNNISYITTSYISASLTLINVTDKSNPIQISSFVNGSAISDARDIKVVGDYAYIAGGGYNNIVIMNISDKINPIQIGTLKNSTYPNPLIDTISVEVLGDYAYTVSFMCDSLTIINISDKTNPTLFSYFENDTSLHGARDVIVIEDYAYISNINDRLIIINISDKTNPVQVSSIHDSDYLDYPDNKFFISNNIAYIAGRNDDVVTAVNVTDVTNPTIIVSIGNATYLNAADKVFVSDDYVYVVGSSQSGPSEDARSYLTILNATIFPSDLYLETGTPDEIYEWNQTGEFNNDKTLDFSFAISSALNNGACDCEGCNLDSDNCLIPFLFHSDSAGKLEYYDLNISYQLTGKYAWSNIGNHSESSVLNWNITNITEQSGVDLKCRARDLNGSNIYSNYYDPKIGMSINAITPNITEVITINEEGIVDGDILRGENVTFNVTVTDKGVGVESVWLKIWQGAIGISAIIWQGFLSFVSGDLWTVEVETNESFSVGENNYTIYANDSLGNEINESGEFEVTGVEVDKCQTLDIPNILYRLTSDITNNTLTEPCISITAQNITLDCQGHLITSNANVRGVYSNQIGTTIINCNIDVGSGAGGYGIELNSANNSKIINNTLDNQYRALQLTSIKDSLIENNTANNNGLAGILIESSTNNTLVNNKVNNTSNYGIYFYKSSENYLTDSVVGGSSSNGIRLDSSLDNVLINNLLDDNYKGVSILGGANNNFFKDSDFSNTDTDVYISPNNLNNTFLNCSFDSEYVGFNSSLIRKWYYRAYVKDYEGNNPVEGVNVSAFNSSDYQFNLTTNSSGYTQLGSIVEYVNSGARDYYSHIIYADNITYLTSHEYNVTSEKNNLHDNFTLGVPDDSYKFYIKNNLGENVAWFGDWGNIVLEGSCFIGDCSSPGDDSLIVRNSTENYVAYVNSTGDMCISSGDCSDESANCDSPVDALAIRNESEDVVSYINGSLCLVGGLYENVEL